MKRCGAQDQHGAHTVRDEAVHQRRVRVRQGPQDVDGHGHLLQRGVRQGEPQHAEQAHRRPVPAGGAVGRPVGLVPGVGMGGGGRWCGGHGDGSSGRWFARRGGRRAPSAKRRWAGHSPVRRSAWCRHVAGRAGRGSEVARSGLVVRLCRAWAAHRRAAGRHERGRLPAGWRPRRCRPRLCGYRARRRCGRCPPAVQDRHRWGTPSGPRWQAGTRAPGPVRAAACARGGRAVDAVGQPGQ